jgi:hypothetical protein
VVHDALRVARGARCVVERDRVPLVRRVLPVVVGIALFQQGVIGGLAKQRTARRGGIVDIDDERLFVQKL